MFERHKGGERAILVHIDFPNPALQGDLEEFRALVTSSGVAIADVVTGSRPVPDSKYFVGSGKAEEIKDVVTLHCADVVLFDHTLTPGQERDLEKLFQCRVVDRNGVILDIFAQRARTFEGKLQVELAQLHHISTRLIRGWTHLERQKGGIGLRGPGETQLETDRRLLRKRITHILGRLEKVKAQRFQNRQARQKQNLPTVSIVGYTNAGKSSLFNTLTGEAIYAADQLFATLDPTMRRMALPGCGDVILADTVGFIRHLPHDLVEAFKATLEETREADLLLHIIDRSDPKWRETADVVREILKEIGASEVPVIDVYNKIDLLSHQDKLITEIVETKAVDVTTEKSEEINMSISNSNELGNVDNSCVSGAYESAGVNISALTGEGLDTLKQEIGEKLYGDFVYTQVGLKPDSGKLRAELHELDAVIDEQTDEEGNTWVTVKMSKTDFDRIFGLSMAKHLGYKEQL